MFDTGKCNIYRKIPQQSADGTPYEVLVPYAEVWYGELNFSVTEYYAAKQAEAKVSRRVRIHQDRAIKSGVFVFVIDDVQYDTGRVYHADDKGIPITDITLEDVPRAYAIKGD